MKFYAWRWRKSLTDLRDNGTSDKMAIYLLLSISLPVLYNDLLAYTDKLSGNFTGCAYGVSPIVISGYLLGFYILKRIQLNIADNLFLERFSVLWYAAELRFCLFFIVPVAILELLSLKYPLLDVGLYYFSPGVLYRSVFFRLGYYLKGLFILYGFIYSYRNNTST